MTLSLERAGVLTVVSKIEEGELMGHVSPDTGSTEDTLFSVGRCVNHVCPVCHKEWKLSLFSASCRPGGGPQQHSAAQDFENISFCQTEVLLPPGSVSSGVYPQ